ncbi:hypothetical protein P22_0220 [Propionispora sp. 2/2-37]|uniref:sporulation protein YqfD n=1 Tax=Propionispora sp. 2/2-37 TaxID=1677858 RepID=UPI0006BB752F|nr:sporulation protein YqfD [Propionispora sp. 2/2-37]CUH94158.1 hypothetical protein P22_0220 [Propionispora sp. 2/2-37]
MTLNVLNYINGHVVIRISGPMPERFINLCTAEGIFLWGIKSEERSLYAHLRLKDFFRIRTLVRKSRNTIKVIDYGGFPFILKKIRQRKMIVVGVLLFFILLNILSSYIWIVEVTGTKSITPETVMQISGKNGLKVGLRKEKADLAQIEKELILQIPQLAWVGIHFTGTRAVIEVVEKTIPQAEDKHPADIVAQKDGIITEIIVLNGQPNVKKGDTVKRGEVLIRGVIPLLPEGDGNAVRTENVKPAELTRAKGIVKSRVWYESYGESEMSEHSYSRTGRRDMEVKVKIGTNQFILKKAHPDQYPIFEEETIQKKLPGWRNRDLLVESTISIFYELNDLYKEFSYEEACDRAKNKALSVLQASMPEGAQVLTREVTVINTMDPGVVRVKVSIETIEDIGQSVNISSY